MADTGQQRAPGDADTPVIPGYDRLELISRGSTAKVYRAVQSRLGRPVAVKVLRIDDELTTADQVEQELATTVALSAQPHIVSIIDTGTTSGNRPYIVMEYCEGGSYGHILARSGPLPVPEVVDVGIKVAEALQAAHEVGIIHRDVKPHNVLRSRYGPALTDFGIARAAGDLTGTITLNKLTPQHASPEALRRQAQGPASDIYSLASTMWNLLAGYPPFADPGDNSPDPFEYRERALRDPLPLLPRPDVAPWLLDELARGMAKAPGDRHASAAGFADALRRGWARDTGQVWTPPPTYRPSTAGGTDQPGRVPSGFTGQGSTGFGQPSAPPPAPVSPFPAAPFPASGSPAAPPGPPVPFPASTPFPEPSGPAPSGPGVGPAGTPDPGRGQRRVGIWPFVAAAVAGVLIGVGVLVALRLGAGGKDTPAAQHVDRTPSPTAGASQDPSIMPTDVRLVDHRTWVRLTWSDHSHGKALYFVTGSPAGTTPRKLSQPDHGTSRRIDGLRPDVDYCFNVVALLTVERISPSDRVCTHRTGTPSARPTA